MIRRDKYLQQLLNNRNNGFPKVITGIRRCGKSYLLKEIYKQYLTEHGVREEDILLIELDDFRNVRLRDPLVLGEYVRKYCDGRKSCYVFLDEIQMVYIKHSHHLTESCFSCVIPSISSGISA